MLTTLLESRGRSPRRRIAMSASAIAHCVLLVMLVMARARGDSIGGPDDPEVTNLVYVEPQRGHAPRGITDLRTAAQPSVVLPTILPPIVWITKQSLRQCELICLAAPSSRRFRAAAFRAEIALRTSLTL